jgi:hypothetical protein
MPFVLHVNSNATPAEDLMTTTVPLVSQDTTSTMANACHVTKAVPLVLVLMMMNVSLVIIFTSWESEHVLNLATKPMVISMTRMIIVLPVITPARPVSIPAMKAVSLAMVMILWIPISAGLLAILRVDILMMTTTNAFHAILHVWLATVLLQTIAQIVTLVSAMLMANVSVVSVSITLTMKAAIQMDQAIVHLIVSVITPEDVDLVEFVKTVFG